MKHYSVLAKESINSLNIKPEGIYIDCTLGLGGHTRLIAERANKGKVIAFEQDSIVLEEAKKTLSDLTNIIFVNDNFVNIQKRINELGIQQVDGIFYDLGTSYYQLTDINRGFTYHDKAKLDMRMNQKQDLSAIQVLNEYDEEELSDIFWKYGDEKRSRQLAKAIVTYREVQPIIFNTELNNIIKTVKGYSKEKHPSKNIYQAIRIEVNDEIGVIKKSLVQAIDLLKKQGVLAVITFHSLEDKVVKEIFWKYKSDITITQFGNEFKYKTAKNVYPTKEEVEINKASRSAKLRTLIKLIDTK